MASQDMFPVAAASNLAKEVFQVEKNNTATFESQYPFNGIMEFNLPENSGLPQENEIVTSLNWSAGPNFDEAGIDHLKHPKIDSSNFLCQLDAVENKMDFYMEPYSSVGTAAESLVPSEEITLDSFEGFSTIQDLLPEEVSTVESPLSIESVDSSVSSKTEEPSNRHSMEISPALATKKYLNMRLKNNVACKRSRKIRKIKDLEMVDKLKELEIENKTLSLLVEELEEQKNNLTKQLMQAVSKK